MGNLHIACHLARGVVFFGGEIIFLNAQQHQRILSSSPVFSVTAADFRTFSDHSTKLPSPSDVDDVLCMYGSAGCRLWHTLQKSWFRRGVVGGGGFTLLFRTASAETTKPWLF